VGRLKLNQLIRSVALVGMDGSGKSTQATNLYQALKEQNSQVLLIHPFGWKILSFLSTRSHPKSTAIGELKRGKKFWQTRIIKRLIAWVEIFDIALYIWLAYVRCFLSALFYREQVWLISDRSFDDLLVKHLNAKTLTPFLLTTLRGFIPRAKITMWLHTEPNIARARDGEFPDSYYVELQKNYSTAAGMLGWQVIQTSDRSREAVFAEIMIRLGLLTQDDKDGQLAQRNSTSPTPVDSLKTR